MIDKQPNQTHANNDKPTIGISACLTGQKVRFDSSHKRSHFCMQELGQHVKYQSYCPEVAIGLPTPRPTIRQIDHGDIITVSRPDGSMDVTKDLTNYSNKTASNIEHLSGFIFTAKSPSCGMERVKVYHHNGQHSLSNGVGVFADAIMKKNPSLPCEENGRLNDAILRENFVLRVFAYHHFQQIKASGLTRHKLFDFQAKYKYLLMSHCSGGYKVLGQLLAQSQLDIDTLGEAYLGGFMAALSKPATRKTHTNTLQHIQGYFSKHLNKKQRSELTEQIMAYHQGIVPLFSPLTLLKHYLNEFENQYLNLQVYFKPYPDALKLRYGL